MTVAVATADIEQFRALVAQHLGLHFEDAKLDFLAEVLQHRMEAAGCGLFSSYQKRITPLGEADELRRLAEQLTVCETYFLRYAEHFRAFAEMVVPNRMQAQMHQRRLRILSAGCASGEEAYSLAIVLRERFPELASWDVAILGIDVNASMVGKALRGRYSSWSLRETPADVQRKYFRCEGREFLLDASLKTGVTFEERNLVDEAPSIWQSEVFDVVFCRNVMMYFTAEVTRSVVARIARSLAPGGFLFLGHAETLRGVSQEFHLLHTHETFYYQRREAADTNDSGLFSQAPDGNGCYARSIPAIPEPADSWFDVIQRASERITDLTEGKNGDAMDVRAPAPKVTKATPPPAWDPALAIELMRKERFGEAMKLVRAFPAESDADPDTQLLLAVLLTNGGDLPEAEKVCRQVLKLDELNAGAHYLMALCKEHAGDRDAAVEHDQAATYLDAAFAMPHLHWGLVAKRCADVETARRELGQALPLLDREDASRILLFGGGFTREALVEFCRAELRACGGAA